MIQPAALDEMSKNRGVQSPFSDILLRSTVRESSILHRCNCSTPEVEERKQLISGKIKQVLNSSEFNIKRLVDFADSLPAVLQILGEGEITNKDRIKSAAIVAFTRDVFNGKDLNDSYDALLKIENSFKLHNLFGHMLDYVTRQVGQLTNVEAKTAKNLISFVRLVRERLTPPFDKFNVLLSNIRDKVSIQFSDDKVTCPNVTELSKSLTQLTLFENLQSERVGKQLESIRKHREVISQIDVSDVLVLNLCAEYRLTQDEDIKSQLVDAFKKIKYVEFDLFASVLNETKLVVGDSDFRILIDSTKATLVNHLKNAAASKIFDQMQKETFKVGTLSQVFRQVEGIGNIIDLDKNKIESDILKVVLSKIINLNGNIRSHLLVINKYISSYPCEDKTVVTRLISKKIDSSMHSDFIGNSVTKIIKRIKKYRKSSLLRSDESKLFKRIFAKLESKLEKYLKNN